MSRQSKETGVIRGSGRSRTMEHAGHSKEEPAVKLREV
jgi:hypothetical protein